MATQVREVKFFNTHLNAYRIKRDINGNPRYVINMPSVYEALDGKVSLEVINEVFKNHGWYKYTGKDFQDGRVGQSYSLPYDMARIETALRNRLSGGNGE